MGIIISLFDYTGNMVKPWVDMGHKAVIIDHQHDSSTSKSIRRIKMDLTSTLTLPSDLNIDEIVFVAAFPPCNHLAVSGARWFKGKGLRKLQESISMFATAAEFCELIGAPYFIENPVSTISTYWRKPDYIFNPFEFTGWCVDDNYTKKTCLWTGGGFVMPEAYRDTSLGPPDDRIHKAVPGPNRCNLRSMTPQGFAQAVYWANENLGS